MRYKNCLNCRNLKPNSIIRITEDSHCIVCGRLVGGNMERTIDHRIDKIRYDTIKEILSLPIVFKYGDVAREIEKKLYETKE